MTATKEDISKPQRIPARDKAATTDHVAREIIAKEAARRADKTERLRQLREAREADAAKATKAAKPAKPARRAPSRKK